MALTIAPSTNVSMYVVIKYSIADHACAHFVHGRIVFEAVEIE